MFSEEEKRGVKYIISDVDDTITTDGLLYPEALSALYKIQEKGLKCILVTGGSAGWADTYIRQWPVDAVIAESGALLIYKKNGNIIYKVNPALENDECRRKRATLLRETQNYPFSSDQYARLFDVAYEKKRLTREMEASLFEIIESLSLSALVSSIHVNVLLCPLSKKKGLDCFFPILKEELALSDEIKDFYRHGLALGDSLNDEALFSSFSLSVGNKRVKDNISSFRYKPTYTTDLYGSASFAYTIEKLFS